jgi:eukaryotic-like serine/threonine-protein kinase
MGSGDPPFPGLTRASTSATADEPTRLAVDTPPGSPSPSGLLQPGTALGTRYRILCTLGAGGMGVVYKAWDEDLGVAVAMKVIRPEVMADPAIASELEQRFKRELLLARQVSHRNVVRIHDIGDVSGMRYITMSYIDGVDLAAFIDARGAVPVPEALALARQIASGLQAAHDAGVVHRDLKPPNIMFDGKLAILMDFGIARAEAPAGEGATIAAGAAHRSIPALAGGMTTVGTVIGTAEYMAPEQLQGKPADHRADIYAFGLIVRDMLLGLRQPDRGVNLGDALRRRFESPPESVRSKNSAIPEALDAIVQRCLQPSPVDRYQSMQEVLAALDRLDEDGNPLPVRRLLTARFVSLLGVIAAILIVGTWWLVRTPPPPPAHAPLPLLVADFDNRVNDPVFAGALEEALGIAMESASFITAFPRRQARQTAARIKAGDRLTESVARLISRSEGLKVILAGSIDRDGTGYKVSVRALDPGAEGPAARPLAEASARASTKADVLPALGTVAAKLRGALGETRTERARQAVGETFTAGSLDAMQAYVHAQQLALANDYKSALQAYDRAIALDPGLGRAYTGIAVIYTNIYKDERKADTYYKEAMRHVDRMTDREKYRTMGAYYLLGVRNYEKAIETYDALVRSYPADDVGHFNLALAMVNVGNLQGAVAEVRKGLEVHPGNSLQRYNYAVYSMYAGDFDTTIAQAKTLIAADAAFEYNHQPLALASAARGDIAGARAEYDRLAHLSAFGTSMARVGIADLEMYLGRPRAALMALGVDGSTPDPSGNGTIAQQLVVAADVFLALGDKARAAAAARRAIQASTHESILYPAARALIAAGVPGEARQVASTLENMLQRQTVAYARLIDGELALDERRTASAIEAFQDAQKRQDTWMSRFLLGRTYAQAGHYPEALRELELCVKRRGEATDAFFYDMPTLRYLPPAYYWLARTQEAQGTASDARKTYEQFLALRRDAEPGDALVADARRRLN